MQRTPAHLLPPMDSAPEITDWIICLPGLVTRPTVAEAIAYTRANFRALGVEPIIHGSLIHRESGRDTLARVVLFTLPESAPFTAYHGRMTVWMEDNLSLYGEW